MAHNSALIVSETSLRLGYLMVTTEPRPLDFTSFNLSYLRPLPFTCFLILLYIYIYLCVCVCVWFILSYSDFNFSLHATIILPVSTMLLHQYWHCTISAFDGTDNSTLLSTYPPFWLLRGILTFAADFWPVLKHPCWYTEAMPGAYHYHTNWLSKRSVLFLPLPTMSV
jgi:hypothetical protein